MSLGAGLALSKRSTVVLLVRRDLLLEDGTGGCRLGEGDRRQDERQDEKQQERPTIPERRRQKEPVSVLERAWGEGKRSGRTVA